MGDLDKRTVQKENTEKIVLSARQRADANNTARQKALAEKSAARTEQMNKIQQNLANKRLADLKTREVNEFNENAYVSDYTTNALSKINQIKNDSASLDFNNNDTTTQNNNNIDIDFTNNSKTFTSSANNSNNTDKFDFVNYDQNKEYTESDTATIDTINNIGSFMNERITEGVKKSLRRMDFTPTGEIDTITPIAYPTIKLAEELGIQYALSDSATNLHEAVSEEISSVDGKGKKFNERDNSLGDAWVVNPPFQFNPHDDVRSNLSFPHFGRVFNEKINSNYPIVVFEVGTIKYSENMLNNTAFQNNDSDVGLTKRIRGGKDISLGDVIGFPVAMVGTVMRTSWKVLTFPVNMLLGLRKFAIFQTDTALFAKYFNDIAQAFATNLGLLQPIDIKSTEDIDFSSTDELTNAKKVEEKLSNSINDPKAIDPIGSYAGIRKRLIFESVVPESGWGAAESDFIPFLANKDINISESISNSTQANPLAANLNAAAAEAAAAKANNYASGNADDAAKSLMEQLSSKFSHIKGGLFRGDVSTVVSGEGRVTLPDMWSDSSFSRSVSLNFTFTSPYGHNLAIFENTYIPFLLLFCMSTPRQIGSKTFTNPFFVRVNMKGMFSIPMGIIESLTIERGDDKNNWTTEGIPRTIKCSVTIKDLSPVLMMSMARSKFFSLFAGNDGLTSYINTLSGLSIHDQRDFSKKVDKWYKRITERQRANTGSDSLVNVITDTVNPFSYVEPLVRSARSGFLGRTSVKLSQAGFNPFDTTENDRRNY